MVGNELFSKKSEPWLFDHLRWPTTKLEIIYSSTKQPVHCLAVSKNTKSWVDDSSST